MTIHPPKGKHPYSGTPVGVEQSKMQISKLLRDYGVEGVQWTDDFQSGRVALRFLVRDENGQATAFDIRPAPFMEPHKTYNARLGRTETKLEPSWPRALRALYVYLKAKLEAVAFGLTEVRQEFLAQMVIRDAQGREITAGELVLPAIEQGGGQLALNGPKQREGTIDTDARSVGS